jgi:hypothetical protein
MEQYRATAIRLLGRFNDEKIEKELQKIAVHDKQLKARQAAIEALQKGNEGQMRAGKDG